MLDHEIESLPDFNAESENLAAYLEDAPAASITKKQLRFHLSQDLAYRAKRAAGKPLPDTFRVLEYIDGRAVGMSPRLFNTWQMVQCINDAMASRPASEFEVLRIKEQGTRVYCLMSRRSA